MSVLVSIVSQFLLGYNTSVMNAPASVVFPDHSTTEWSIAVSALAFGGPWGAMVGGWLANSFGRRGAMMINNVIFLLGGIIMTFAPSIWWLVPARLLIGFASGVSTVVVPVYLGEIAPPTLRGTLGTCTQFATTIGILLSGLVAFPWATPTRWRYIFAITPVLCIIQLFFSSYLLESPRWLLSNDTDSQHARKNIQKLRGFRSAKEVEDEVQHFIFASNLNKTDDKDDGAGHSALFSLLNSKDMRYLFFSALVLQAGQQLCGICAVFYYSTTFFEGVIDNPLMGTVLVGVVNVLATYLALKLMDNTGRKTLLLVSSGGMMISAMLIIAALKGYVYNIIAAVAVIAFVGFFEIGIGTLCMLRKICIYYINARFPF